MTETTRPRRSRLAQLKEKLDDDTESMREELAKSTLTKKRQIELNEESEYKAVEIKDPQNIEEITRTTTRNLQMTETLMKRLEALEVQQTNNIGPRFTALETKISELSKNASEILESLKNQPQIKELDYKLDPEPQPEPEPEMEPMPELPPLPQLEEESPLDLDQESEPEIPPLPELKLPEEEKTEEPKPEVPKLDSETQTDPAILPEDEEREKRRAERKQRHNKLENPETCEIKERDIRFDSNEFEPKKEENENTETKAEEVAQKEEIEQKQVAEEKSVDVPDASGSGGHKLSFELIALIILIVLEIIHLYVISK